MPHEHSVAVASCAYCRRAFRDAVLGAGAASHRALPWRRAGRSAYELVLAEVLLQQTRAEQVASVFDEIVARASSWEALAAVPIGDLEDVLRPLGLQRRRASTLHGLAIAVCLQGALPALAAELEQLPGIGQYMARAVAAQLHGERVAPIDVNVARVLERVFGPRKLADIRYDPHLQQLAAALVPAVDPGGYLVALLDFAAAICRARAPGCAQCPVPRCQYACANGTR